MRLEAALISAWQQMLVEASSKVELEGKEYPVTMSRAKRVRMTEFGIGPFHVAAIEQNPQTGSHWAALAREGSRIMQIRCEGRYVGNVCDGKLIRYPAWYALGLPE